MFLEGRNRGQTLGLDGHLSWLGVVGSIPGQIKPNTIKWEPLSPCSVKAWTWGVRMTPAAALRGPVKCGRQISHVTIRGTLTFC